jgi:hypothetical protein
MDSTPSIAIHGRYVWSATDPSGAKHSLASACNGARTSRLEIKEILLSIMSVRAVYEQKGKRKYERNIECGYEVHMNSRLAHHVGLTLLTSIGCLI